MFKTILSNLLGYDLIILLAAAINGFILYPRVKKASVQLKNHLQPKVYVPINKLVDRIKDHTEPEKSIDLHALKSMRSDEIHYYSLFTAFNSAFPMLGMLGTIISLLQMIDLSQQQVVLNFTTALTSTLWGLVFALVFKAFDAALSPIVEQNQENIKLMFERIDLATRVEESHE